MPLAGDSPREDICRRPNAPVVTGGFGAAKIDSSERNAPQS